MANPDRQSLIDALVALLVADKRRNSLPSQASRSGPLRGSTDESRPNSRDGGRKLRRLGPVKGGGGGSRAW
jgi:hypothetical protein